MSESKFIMPAYDALTINLNGVDYVVVVFPEDVDKRRPEPDKQEVLEQLEKCVQSSTLTGTVAFVWPKDDGSIGRFPDHLVSLWDFVIEKGYEYIKKTCNPCLPISS